MMNYEEFFRERQARALRGRQGQVPRLLLKLCSRAAMPDFLGYAPSVLRMKTRSTPGMVAIRPNSSQP